jgi:hypothetical protein
MKRRVPPAVSAALSRRILGARMVIRACKMLCLADWRIKALHDGRTRPILWPDAIHRRPLINQKNK